MHIAFNHGVPLGSEVSMWRHGSILQQLSVMEFTDGPDIFRPCVAVLADGRPSVTPAPFVTRHSGAPSTRCIVVGLNGACVQEGLFPGHLFGIFTVRDTDTGAADFAITRQVLYHPCLFFIEGCQRGIRPIVTESAVTKGSSLPPRKR